MTENDLRVFYERWTFQIRCNCTLLTSLCMLASNSNKISIHNERRAILLAVIAMLINAKFTALIRRDRRVSVASGTGRCERGINSVGTRRRS